MEIIQIDISEGDMSDIKSLHAAFCQTSEPYKSLSEETKAWILNWSLSGCHELKEQASGGCTAVTRAVKSLGAFSKNQLNVIDVAGKILAVRKDLREEIIPVIRDLIFYGPERVSALDWVLFGIAMRNYHENQN